MCPQRATAGLRRTTAELTDDNHDNGNPITDSSTPVQPADPVNMEISSSPPLTDPETENLISWHSQEVEECHYPEVHGVQQSIRFKQEDDEPAKGQNGERDGEECDYLVFEIGEQKGGEGGGESEEGQETERGGEDVKDRERGETEGEDEGRGEIEIEDEERGKIEEEDGSKGETESEDWKRREIEGENGSKGKTESEDWGRRQIEGEDESKGETESKDWGTREIEEEDEGRVKIEGEDEGMVKIEGEDEGRVKIEGEYKGIGDTEWGNGRSGDTKEEGRWIGEIVGEMKDDAHTKLLFISDSPVCTLSSEPLIVTSDTLEEPAAAMLQEDWDHDIGNRDDLSDGHLSDCLQAELAIVYSDSDAGEDQRAVFAPRGVTNQEEARERIHDSICDGDSKEEEREGDNEDREKDVEKEQEERRGDRDDDEEQMRSRRDLFLRSPSVSSTASSTDPDKRVRLFPLYM